MLVLDDVADLILVLTARDTHTEVAHVTQRRHFGVQVSLIEALGQQQK